MLKFPHRPSIRKETVAAALALCASAASAFQPLVTDDTGTQGQGGNQVELAGTTTKDNGGKTREGVFTYTRGLTDGLDVFAELGRQRLSPLGGASIKGPSNSSVGAKWRFFENQNKTSLAIKPIYVFPVSEDKEADGMGSGKATYELSLILTQEMEWGAVHANLLGGRNRFRDQAVAEDEKVRHFSVAPVWNVDDKWKLAVDLGAEHVVTESQKTRSRFGELGAIYSPNADLDFALGLIRARERDSRALTKSATAGVTWRFK
jgi:hypothetical protein